MKRKQKAHEKEPNLERWLVSYADFITLLFAVFVTLYAMSMVDKKKVDEVKSSIQRSFGYAVTSEPGINVVPSLEIGTIPEVTAPQEQPQAQHGQDGSHAEAAEFARILEGLQSHLARSGLDDEVRLTITERGLVVSLKEGGFFASGSAVLQPEALPALDHIAATLAGYANNIRIEGHTDNVPLRSAGAASNWELSTARATNVVHYLVDRHRFAGARLSATGFGEYRPVADNTSEAGRRLNRRVDIVLLSTVGAKGEPRQRREE